MKRKRLKPKHKFVVLFLPLFLTLSAAITYGALQDYVNLNLGLTATQRPTIKVSSALLNAPDNSVTVIVKNTTKTVENTDPNPLQIRIKVTNTGAAPITKLELNATLPTDWDLTPPLLLQLVETDKKITEVDPTQVSVIYDSKSKTFVISVPDIKKATGRFLTRNETFLVFFSITYNLIGNLLPPEYENEPPTYTETATATAYVTGWQSKPITNTLVFTTNISWI